MHLVMREHGEGISGILAYDGVLAYDERRFFKSIFFMDMLPFLKDLLFELLHVYSTYNIACT
jgi:hypothetical protein